MLECSQKMPRSSCQTILSSDMQIRKLNHTESADPDVTSKSWGCVRIICNSVRKKALPMFRVARCTLELSWTVQTLFWLMVYNGCVSFFGPLIPDFSSRKSLLGEHTISTDPFESSTELSRRSSLLLVWGPEFDNDLGECQVLSVWCLYCVLFHVVVVTMVLPSVLRQSHFLIPPGMDVGLN